VLRRLGVRDYPAAGLFGRFYGRIYFNQTLFQALMNRFYPSRAGWRAAPRLLWTALRAGLLVLTLPAKSRRIITAILKQARYEGQGPSKITVWRRLGCAAMEVHLAISVLAELLYQVLDKVLLHWGDGMTTAAILTAGLTGVRSAEAGQALANLGRLAAQDAELRKLIQTTSPENLLASLDTTDAGRTFAAHLTAFLDKYGHGAAEEFELASPRWRDDPVIVLRALRSQVLLETADTYHKVDPTADRLAATARIEGRLGLLRRFLFRYLLHQTQAFIATRENLKYHFVIAHSCLRDCYLTQAQVLVAAGQLPDVGDIFFLTADEVIALTEEQLTRAEGRSLVAARQRRWDMDRRVAPPPALDQGADGRYWPITAVKEEFDAGGVVLRGFAAGPGTYTGRARVIRTPDEGAQLQPGEVLVAPAASPGWTPLFLTAGALITEIGGALSHAAIIAREYGLPAVLNVTDALNRIHTGQLVHVDGTVGIVNLIEEVTDRK
jgi:pyruvate,water dikinase